MCRYAKFMRIFGVWCLAAAIRATTISQLVKNKNISLLESNFNEPTLQFT